MPSSQLDHLFSPIKVGSMQLKNRIVLLPMALYANGGMPSDRQAKFLLERARGGAGVVCMPLNVIPGGSEFVGTMTCDVSEDRFIKPLSELIRQVHDCGVPIVGQLISLMLWRKDAASPLEVVGPSEVALRPRAHKPRAMTAEEIHLFCSQYAEAAARARKAGFDAIEIMGGIGGTISRFMSPAANQRQDEYGGTFENRMRMPLEVMQAIKKGAGVDFTILWRYSGHEFIDGGYDEEEGAKIGRALESAGAGWLNLQVGWHDSTMPLVTKEVPQGRFVYIAERIRKSVGIPVVTGYRITDPEMADRIIAEGNADLIGMARALVSDPELPNKAREGRLHQVNRCICCCRCLDQGLAQHIPVELCSVNARMGDDILTDILPAPVTKKVLVVGGGPAGMEAARVAAMRGHSVTLWEKSHRLGGLLQYAKVPSEKWEIGYFIDYLTGRMRDLGVAVVLDKEADCRSVMDEGAEAVILATGSIPCDLKAQGTGGTDMLTPLDYLSGRKTAGANVVVIGGGTIGCEIAGMLAAEGKRVTIMEIMDKVGRDIGPTERFIILSSLKRQGVAMEAATRAVEITTAGVVTVRDGKTMLFEADTVIVATGMQPDNELSHSLAALGGEFYAIGDCVEPKRIGEAVKSAYRTALRI
jgi:2,4-dienoyl-CoA reductase (NADPH2)